MNHPHELFWKKAKADFEYELEDRKSFNRQYALMQEYDYTEDFAKIYRPKLDSWRGYLCDAINHHLGKPYTLKDYSNTELENIVTLLDEAIKKPYSK